MSDFENRLRKNLKAREPWARRVGTTAYRLYDLDIPEVPFAVDRYGDFIHVMEYPSRKQRRDGAIEQLRQQVVTACTAVLQVPAERIFFKTHEPHGSGEQYSRVGQQSVLTVVEEAGARFEINLSDFLDTGLFLDHRPLRLRVRKESAGKRVLNLFAYTGSFSVHAAQGNAASTTTVDLSAQYCAWTERNFKLNNIATGKVHQVIPGDVLQWLERTTLQWDLIVLDPPSFSTSKKMQRSWNVQRDHVHLIETTLERLAPGGTLYFSTNMLEFELSEALTPVEELKNTLPDDFRRQVHRAWKFGK